jgi:RNA polymerase sigma factor (sigma-70 family)
MIGAPLIRVVDDDSLFRDAVARLLRAAGYQVALYESGDQLLQNLSDLDPGCILLDLRMSDLDGLELQDRLKEAGCILPIVFLTGYGDIPSTVKAMKAGADDFLSKPVAKGPLLAAIERALDRYSAQREDRDRIGGLRSHLSELTTREREVFSLVVRGKLNKEIAFEIGTSERTVKAHRHSAMKKLKVRSVAAAVSIAERLGMLKPQSD